jgi:hypothetical protein
MARAPMPRTIKVGPYTYTLDSDVPHAHLGQTDVDAHRLHIKDGQPRAAEQDTVLHETMHAVIDAAGWTGTKMQKRCEERFIRILAPGLLDALRRNKTLRDYLFS